MSPDRNFLLRHSLTPTDLDRIQQAEDNDRDIEDLLIRAENLTASMKALIDPVFDGKPDNWIYLLSGGLVDMSQNSDTGASRFNMMPTLSVTIHDDIQDFTILPTHEGNILAPIYPGKQRNGFRNRETVILQLRNGTKVNDFTFPKIDTIDELYRYTEEQPIPTYAFIPRRFRIGDSFERFITNKQYYPDSLSTISSRSRASALLAAMEIGLINVYGDIDLSTEAADE